jgi:CubicO group peptidase (beta-lactamase class C family)
MTADTLFTACSTTKQFTAAATSLVIDDSKSTADPISWDTPLSSVIREDFVLSDEYATTHTTFEDALSHRSGYPMHSVSVEWVDKDETVQEHVRKMRHLPVAYQPRTTFNYSNSMFVAVTHALQQKTGEELGSFLKRRLWEPAGMHDTFFSVKEATASHQHHRDRLARGYTWIKETQSYKEEPLLPLASTTGAGSVVSTVLDYAKWLKVLLDPSQSALGAHGLGTLLEPRITSKGFLPPAMRPLRQPAQYAMGWFVENYNGYPFYTHGGNWPGAGIMLGFMPDKNLGFVMMGNTKPAILGSVALYMHLFEKVLGPTPPELLRPSPTTPSNGAAVEKDDEETAAKKKHFPSLSSTSPIPHALPLETYTGTYYHPGYGAIPVNVNDKSGRLMGDLTDRTIETCIDLIHVTAEHFLAKTYTPGGGGEGVSFYAAAFELGPAGRPERLGIAVEKALGGEKAWFVRQD